MGLAASSDFTRAFQEAGGQSVHLYSDLIRFMAVMFVILGVMWCLCHFLDAVSKSSDEFMAQTGVRVVKLAVGLTLFILFLS